MRRALCIENRTQPVPSIAMTSVQPGVGNSRGCFVSWLRAAAGLSPTPSFFVPRAKKVNPDPPDGGIDMYDDGLVGRPREIAPLNPLLRFVRQLRRHGPRYVNATDQELLARYVKSRDEAAFETVLVRYAPMVFGVCRRVVACEADADDAFQATFIVLSRKASDIREQSLGNWLYGVAHRVSLKAKSMAYRRARQTLERQLAGRQALRDLREPDASSVLDEEVMRLPAKYRVPLVLFYFQGKTKREIGGELGCPEGTISARLARGRKQLRRRLATRGISSSSDLFASVCLLQAIRRPVPSSLCAAALRAAAGVLGGKAAIGNVVGCEVASRLAREVMKDFFLLSVLKGTVASLAVSLLIVGPVLGRPYLLQKPANTGQHHLVVQAPTIVDFCATYDSRTTLWTFSGRVIDESCTGLAVVLRIPSLGHVSVVTDKVGRFSYTVQAFFDAQAIAEAQATNWRGIASDIVVVNI